jgi:hypothetical protein
MGKMAAERAKSMAARGGKKYAEDWIPSNFILLYGTKPGAMVNLDTNMVNDFIDNIWRRLDKKTLSVTFPDCLDQMKTEDADFEMAVSNTIQKLNLFHRESIYKAHYAEKVTSQMGVIFMNSKTLDKEYYTDKLRQSLLKTTQDLFDYLEI